jgi:peptidoglycan-N-acetylglucosamine deacetylase
MDDHAINLSPAVCGMESNKSRHDVGRLSRRGFLSVAAGLCLAKLAHAAVGRSKSVPDQWEDHVEPPRELNDRFLKKYDRRFSADDRSLFLTFDDGPLVHTGRILELLAEKRHKATFFVLGRNLETPSLRKLAVKALQDGHDLGNHSYDHPDFSTISAKRAVREIIHTHALIQELVAEAEADATRQNLFFRFPYGVTGSRSNHIQLREILAELNYRVAGWDLDTRDWAMDAGWFGRSPSRVIASLKSAKPWDVVLLHDRLKTAQNLDRMLEVLDSQSLMSVPLSDLEFGHRMQPEKMIEVYPALDLAEPPPADQLTEELLETLLRPPR